MNSLVDLNKVPVIVKNLHVPPLEQIAQVLNEGLKTNFETVQVEVVDCPDLTQPPFTLTAAGFGGRPQIVEVGGVPYLMPLVKREKLYDMKGLLEYLGRDPGFVVGAGAGPWPYPGVNCEGIINLFIEGGKVKQGTRIVTVVPHGASKEEGRHKVETLPASETRAALLGNFIVSDGKPSKVVKVVCKKRIGQKNFITSIRETLKDHYKENVVGLGGTFLQKEGKSKQHVMPDFSTTPIDSEEAVDQWLRFFEMSAPLVHLGTLVTGDLDLDLRVQHFHCFSHHGDGGHYHYDTTPDAVEYVGYFAPGETIVRIDAPPTTHSIGRD